MGLVLPQTHLMEAPDTAWQDRRDERDFINSKSICLTRHLLQAHNRTTRKKARRSSEKELVRQILLLRLQHYRGNTVKIARDPSDTPVRPTLRTRGTLLAAREDQQMPTDDSSRPMGGKDPSTTNEPSQPDNCSPLDLTASEGTMGSRHMHGVEGNGNEAVSRAVQGSSKKRNSKGMVVAAATAAVFLLSGIGAAIFYAPQFFKTDASGADKKSAPPVVTVSVASSKYADLADVVNVTGSVSAWDPLSIGAEVDGLRIMTVNVEEGDFVKRGQVLATLNSTVLNAQLEQAQAKYESSQANLIKTQQPNRPEDILSIKAALEQAEAAVNQEEALERQARATLADAHLNARRYAALAAQGAVSKADSDTRQTTLRTAAEGLRSEQAKVKAAKFIAEQSRERYLIAMRGGRKEDVQISQASIKEMKGTVDQLKAQIEQTIIRSPEDGLVSKRDAHVGEVSTSGKPLFYIVRDNKLELRAQVADIDLSKFQPGQLVTVKPTAEDPRTATGRVWLVSPQVDTVTRLGTVRIELPINSWLKPGMFVEGEVNLGKRQMLTVPVASVVTHGGESRVFTLDGDRARAIPVKIGVRTDELAEVISGITADQPVVVKGAGFLADGDPVRIAR